MVDLRNSIIAQYKLNDVSGTTAIDSSGNGHNGTIVGTEHWGADGKSFSAFHFTKADSNFVDIETIPFAPTATFTESYSFWVKIPVLPGSGYMDLVQNMIDGTGFENGFSIFFHGTDGNIRLYAHQTPAITGTTILEADTWYFITVTMSGLSSTDAKLYVNGVEEGSHTNGIITASTGTFAIGGLTGDTDNFSDAIIDNVCVFSKELTQEEISFLYNDGVGTESLYDIDAAKTNNSYFATIGDYDTRSSLPNNANQLLFSAIAPEHVLRTANNSFDHIMVSGVPLSVSACYFSNNTSKFRNAATNDRDFPDLTYFYALDVIAVENVSHQTLTDDERTIRFLDTTLFVNRWNAKNYLNTAESGYEAIPTDTTNLFGTTMGLGAYGELIFNKTSFSLNDVERQDYSEVAFGSNLVSVGRIGNNYYLIITNS